MVELSFFCFFMVFYAYFGYPLVLLAFIKLRRVFGKGCGGVLSLSRSEAASSGEERLSTGLPSVSLPSVSLIVTAKNEESVITAKIEECLGLADYYRRHSGKEVQIIVGSDNSSDRTNEIVRGFVNSGVLLVESAGHSGKEHTQALAIARSVGEVIVFTDAKVRLEENALLQFASYFQNPESPVGAVSSNDMVEGDVTDGSGEGAYVRYDMFLRVLESEFNSLVGLSGSCFAVRRSLAADLRTDIPSDFGLLLKALALGLKGVHASEIRCSYRAVATEEEEFGRKVRTVLRGITAFMANAGVLNPFKYGVFSFQVASHKLGRWLVPWFFLLGTLLAFLSAFTSFWACILAIVLLDFYGAVILAWKKPAIRGELIFKIPLFFVVSNLAILKAWLLYFSGKRSVSWTPSQKVSQ